MKNNKPKTMRNLISINQGVLSDIAPSITFEEAAILDYLIGICSSGHERINEQRVDGYTWVNYTKLLNDMPLLKGRTKITVGKKIKNLEKLNLIQTFTYRVSQSDNQQRKYVKLTPLCNHLYSTLARPINKQNYEVLKNAGLTDNQAKIISSEYEFIKEHLRLIEVRIPNGEFENGGAYLWKSYQYWLSHGSGMREPINGLRRGTAASTPGWAQKLTT